MQNTLLPVKVHGHVLVKDNKTGEVLLDKNNAINPGNMATALARGLSNSSHATIWKIKLGNQGTYIDSSQQIVFRPPNTVGTNADLYNPTYYEIVDDSDAGVGVGNSVTFTNIPNSTSTRVIITCVISANEAVNNPDDAGPSPLDPNGLYFFDELGLFTQGDGTPNLLQENGELLLTHIIMSPIEHTGNRELSIVYSLTISVS